MSFFKIIFGDPMEDVQKAASRAVGVFSCSVKPGMAQRTIREQAVANVAIHFEFLVFLLQVVDRSVFDNSAEDERSRLNERLRQMLIPPLVDFFFRPDSIGERQERTKFLIEYVQKHSPPYYECRTPDASFALVASQVAVLCERGGDKAFISWVESLARKTCRDVALHDRLKKAKKSLRM
jgi:hypothetical protein